MIGKIQNAYGQANTILIDITDTSISIEKAIKDFNEVIIREKCRFVKEIYLKNKNELIGIYVRK